MDKPTLTQEDRELFHYNPNTDDIIERVKAYGDAMAAWGAAQEQAKLHAEIAGLPFEPNDWVVLHKEVHARMALAAGAPSDFPFSGSGLTTCDMHDDESY